MQSGSNPPSLTEMELKMKTAKLDAAVEVISSLPTDDKVQFGFKIETSINELIDNLANRGQDYTDKKGNEVKFGTVYDEYPEDLPTTKVGVILHYVLKGIEEDMKIKFEPRPYALQKRDGTSSSSGGTGERFTKEKKNEILDRCSASNYPNLDMDEIIEEIKKAMEEKKYWEGQGYVLVPEKTKPPMKKDSKKFMDYLEAKASIKQAAQERGAALGAMAKKKAGTT